MHKRLKRTHDHHHRPNRRIPSSYIWAGIGIVVVLVFGAFLFLRSDGDKASSLAPDPNFTPVVEGAPRVEVVQGEVDHGTVKYNRMVRSEFTIRNIGDEPLIINGDPQVEVVEGCCPPKATITSKRLAPGEAAIVSMEYSMHEGMGGPHEFNVHLNTNDPAQPETTFIALSNWVP